MPDPMTSPGSMRAAQHTECRPFADYVDDLLSVFMTRAL
jgi:hypothetical protein